MATAMLTALADLFDEDLVPGIQNKLVMIDKTYREVVESKEVVLDNLTKEYKAIHTFVTSLAGAIRPGSVLGPDMRTDVGVAQMIQAHETYPGVGDTPLAGIANRYIKVGKQRGNIVMNLAMLRGTQLKTVGNYPALTLEQAAENVAHNTAMDWYLNDSAQVIALDVTGTGASISRSGQICTCTGPTATGTVLTDGRYHRIKPAMQFDVWSKNATMATCYTQRGWAMLTSNVDMFSPGAVNIFFQNEQDAIDYTAAAADCWLVPYGALPTRTAAGLNTSILPCGYQWWIRATGTLFGGFGDLDVTTYGSMFKSLIETSYGAVTETKLNQTMKKFSEAVGFAPDTAIMTDGIQVSLLDSYGADATSSVINLHRDQSRPESVQLGYEDPGIGYRYNGMIVKLNTSTFINAGEMTLMKCRDGNLCRYRPPRVPGSEASVSGFDPGLEWLGKVVGDNIWMPSTAPGGGKTDGIEAPFDFLLQHAAKEVRGIQLTGCSEL